MEVHFLSMLDDISLSSRCCCSYVWVIRQPLQGPGLLARPYRPKAGCGRGVILYKVCHVNSVDWSTQQLVERTSHTCSSPVRGQRCLYLSAVQPERSLDMLFIAGLFMEQAVTYTRQFPSAKLDEASCLKCLHFTYSILNIYGKNKFNLQYDVSI